MTGKGAARLIDRIDELDQLRHWLAEAIGGSPRIVVVVGDAGIGKSRLVGELIAEARAAGVRPFAGRCQEGARVPLLPFASVLDTLVPRRDITATQHVSNDVDAAVSLVGAIGRALLAAAADRPVIAVVEDVQWADEATIQLLGHLAATLAHEALFRQLPVALLTTVRPTRVAPAVQQMLSRLTHESIGRSLYLRSLDELHVFELIEARTDARPSVELLRLVNEPAQGNPLEIENLITRLEQADALARRGREVVPTIDDLTRLPPRTHYAGTFEQLPADVQELLVTLALLRDGRLGLLRAATGFAPERFEEAVEYATTDVPVLVDDGVTVDFVDKAFAEAVAATMGTGRRRRCHGEIAARLAAVMPDEGVTASDVVGQLHRAGEKGDAALLAALARDAADEAFAAGAYGDALRHYDAALASPALDGPRRAALHERAAVAAYRNLDRAGAATHAAKAVELARDNDDVALWGDAALLEARVTHRTAPLEMFIAGVGDGEPALRARAHSALSELEFDRLELDAAARNVEIAQRLAREVEDPATIARVEFGAGLQRFGALDLDRAESHFRRAEEFALAASDELVAGWAHNRRPLVAWSRGALEDAAMLAATAATAARANGWWAEYALVASVRAGIALVQGNLSATERLGAEAATAHRRSEQVAVSGILWSALASARTLRGDGAGAYAALDEWAHDDARPRPFYAALVGAFTGVDDPRSDGKVWHRHRSSRAVARSTSRNCPWPALRPNWPTRSPARRSPSTRSTCSRERTNEACDSRPAGTSSSPASPVLRISLRVVATTPSNGSIGPGPKPRAPVRPASSHVRSTTGRASTSTASRSRSAARCSTR